MKKTLSYIFAGAVGMVTGIVLASTDRAQKIIAEKKLQLNAKKVQNELTEATEEVVEEVSK